MSDFLVEEATHNKGAKIKVIGCGGGGGNMINHMVRTGLDSLDLIAANTDAQALAKSLAKTKIQLGEKKTKGLGAGMVPEVGAESARESFEEVRAALSDTDIVFIASGLGGGTGTGATPIIAQAAKEMGALIVSIVTMPFKFEGAERRRLAEQGLIELKKESDSILVIQNEKLRSIIDKKATKDEAFGKVNDILARAVNGMTSILLDSGEVNVDFADVKTVMSHRGMALMGVGCAVGENAGHEAFINAVESPLLDGMDIKGAKGLILNFKTGSEYSFFEMTEVAESIQEMVDKNCKTIWGMNTDENMPSDMVELTIIATGFEDKDKEASKPETNEVAEKKMPFANLKKVSGGYNDEMLAQIDTIPAFLRRQMD